MTLIRLMYWINYKINNWLKEEILIYRYKKKGKTWN